MKIPAAAALLPLLYLGSLSPALAHHCASHDHGCHHCANCDCHHGNCDCRDGQRGRTSPRTPAAATQSESVSGTVSEVIYLPGGAPGLAGVELRLKSGAGETLLRLAPTGFLKKNNFSVKEGQHVSARGFRVDTLDGEVLVATEIQNNGSTLRLRDARGNPLW